MKILYFDCPAGIAGDMTLAALVDLGVDPRQLEADLGSLSPDLPIRLEFKRVDKCGVSALKMELAEPFPQFHHHHYREVVGLIERAGLKDGARQRALAIFEAIAVAEGAIHGLPIEAVHFHEVAAIDSIVDVIGVALAVEQLQPERIVFSPLALGYGEVKCRHGVYPVPALATLEILKGLPVHSGHLPFELTTPTGAAIAKTLAHAFEPGLPLMKVEKIGYGAGTRDLPERPNILRISLGETL
ncbi:MAG: LarC family nickel insertion protein [bacterium]|nr:LarC family nickel insertion protein [bacterium]